MSQDDGMDASPSWTELEKHNRYLEAQLVGARACLRYAEERGAAEALRDAAAHLEVNGAALVDSGLVEWLREQSRRRFERCTFLKQQTCEDKHGRPPLR